MDLLIKLTRAASDLLAVIASPELNDGLANFHMICKTTTSSRLEFICSKSLVGYVLYHDDLSLPILSLVSCIFGKWKDGEAKITSVPFCHKIIQLATATQSDTLVSFVRDDIIPHVIRCLTLESSLDIILFLIFVERHITVFKIRIYWRKRNTVKALKKSLQLG